MVFGSKYGIRVESLKDGLRKGDIMPLEVIAEHNSCYFCLNKIPEGDAAYAVIKENKKVTAKYFLDRDCYYSALGAKFYNDTLIFFN